MANKEMSGKKNKVGEKWMFTEAEQFRKPHISSRFFIYLSVYFTIYSHVSLHFLHPKSIEENRESIGKNMLAVQTGCVCVCACESVCVQGGGETCLLQMWENGSVSESECVDRLIGRVELLS